MPTPMDNNSVQKLENEGVKNPLRKFFDTDEMLAFLGLIPTDDSEEAEDPADTLLGPSVIHAGSSILVVGVLPGRCSYQAS